MKELHKAEQHLKEIEKKLGKDNFFGYINGYDLLASVDDMFKVITR